MSNGTKQKSYGEALRELKVIVDQLRDHSEDIDVDELLEQVKTAKTLIGICEEKLQRADIEINAVLSELRREEEDVPVDDVPTFSTDEESNTCHTSAHQANREEIPF